MGGRWTRTKLAGFVALTGLCAAAALALPSRLPGTAKLETLRDTVAPRLEALLVDHGHTLGDPVHIRIFKQSSELEVWIRDGERFVLFETYPICSYSGALGPKLMEGDRQSPEGFYRVTRDLLNPNSSYHLSFNLGFPNAYDRAHGRTGSYLMVHGKCVSIGCYAMTDEGIEEIYLLTEAALRAGQEAVSVHVYPFRMTDGMMAVHAGSEWIGFWENLKEGHDLFETTGQPPRIGVRDKRYVFGDPAAIPVE